MVASKLMYGLSSVWLNKSERRRLDGLQSRHLRQIVGITHPMLSRISNREVLKRAQQNPLSQTLCRQQLFLFGKAARAPASDPLRDAVFCPGSLRPAPDRFIRKVGRPRLEWATQLKELALQVCGHGMRLEEAIADEKVWKALVNRRC